MSQKKFGRLKFFIITKVYVYDTEVRIQNIVAVSAYKFLIKKTNRGISMCRLVL